MCQKNNYTADTNSSQLNYLTAVYIKLLINTFNSRLTYKLLNILLYVLCTLPLHDYKIQYKAAFFNGLF